MIDRKITAAYINVKLVVFFFAVSPYFSSVFLVTIKVPAKAIIKIIKTKAISIFIVHLYFIKSDLTTLSNQYKINPKEITHPLLKNFHHPLYSIILSSKQQKTPIPKIVHLVDESFDI